LEKQNLAFMVIVAALAVLPVYWFSSDKPTDDSVVVPPISLFLEIHLDTMQTYGLALRGDYSRELLNTKSAMRDLETQVKYSKLSPANKDSFEASLKSLWETTGKAATHMEVLEARTSVVFKFFIERSRIIQRELVQLEASQNRTVALDNLKQSFEFVMKDSDSSMELLDTEAGNVNTKFFEMDTLLKSAYDIFVREKVFQQNEMGKFAEVWSKWGSTRVERDLFEKNFAILKRFDSEHNHRAKQLYQMTNSLSKFRAQVFAIQGEVRKTRLESSNLKDQIKLVNNAIDRLENQYRKHKPIN